jgi:hypothetical protein
MRNAQAIPRLISSPAPVTSAVRRSVLPLLWLM